MINLFKFKKFPWRWWIIGIFAALLTAGLVSTNIAIAPTSVSATGQCILTLTKQVSSATANPGDTLTYTIDIKNTGTANCTGGGIKVQDVVDVNLTFVNSTTSSNISTAYYSIPLYQSGSRTLTWNAHTLTPGKSGQIVWTAIVNTPSSCDTFDIVNTARATSLEYGNFTVWVSSNTTHTNVTKDCKATLIVKKHVINNNAGTKIASDFTMNVIGTNVSSASFAGDETGTTVTLDAGSYSVDETAVDGYTKTLGTDCSGTIAIGETKTCIVTNDDDAPPPPTTGTLIIKKQVVNDNGGTKTAADFTLHVMDTGVDVAGSPVAGSTTGTTYTLLPGTYTVSEDTVPTGYNKTSITGDCSADGTVVLAISETKTCTITNDDIPPQLIVKKQVVNDNGGTKTAPDFTMNVTGTNVSNSSFVGSESGTTVTLDAGTYLVSETAVTNYTSTASSDCTGTIAIGETKICTITNDDIPPQLTIKKHVINNNAGTKIASDFTMNVIGTNVSSASFAGDETGTTVTLDAGSYSVDETAIAGYTKTLGTDCSGTIAIGETKTCTVTNDDDVPPPPSHGIIKVIKLVSNTHGGTKISADFNLHVKQGIVDVTGSPAAGSETGVSYTLLPGTYTVSEDATPTGYNAVFSGDCDGTGTVALLVGENKVCTITNSDVPTPPSTATLIVKKHVINDNGKSQVAADFTMNVTGTNVSNSSFAGSESGTTVTLDAGNYSVDEASSLGYSKSLGSGCSGTIAAGETKTCIVTNDDQGGGGCIGSCGGGPDCNSPTYKINSDAISMSMPQSSIRGLVAQIDFTYGNDVTALVLSNDGSFTQQYSMPLQTSATWTLKQGSGTKTVYAKFFNKYSCSTVKSVATITPPVIEEPVCINLLAEQELVVAQDDNLAKNLSGHIVVQCESTKAAWYISPVNGQRIYLPPGVTTSHILKLFGVDVNNIDLMKIPLGLTSVVGPISTDPTLINTTFAEKQKGKLLVQNESVGELWYINPTDGKRYYVPVSDEASVVAASVGECIKDADLHKIKVGGVVGNVKLNEISACYPPIPTVLGVTTELPRTGFPMAILLALPVLALFAIGFKEVGKDWISN